MSDIEFLTLRGIKFDKRKEVIAGITTFLTMAYIIFVNPLIIGSGYELALKIQLGVDELPSEYQALVNNVKVGIATATIIAAAVGTILMAIFARLPFALAPGMGENAFIAFSVIPAFSAVGAQLGLSGVDAVNIALMVALMAVVVDGVIFFIASWAGIREKIIRSISPNLAIGISVGIGLFITFIGLSLAGFVKAGAGTPVQFNVDAFTSPESILALIGFFIASALYIRKFVGSFLATIIGLTIIGIATGITRMPQQIFSYPVFSTSILPQIDSIAAWYVAMISIAFPVAFSLWLVEFFDGIGTITGLAHKANLVDENGRPINIDKALYTDAAATVIGGLAGTTTTVVYIESASGIESGGRTGITALVVGLLFLLFLPLAPLATVIPGYATAPVLILVGLSFISIVRRMNLDDLTEAIPAFVAMIGIPLTYSIATGIGLAFLTYTAIKILSGRFSDLSLTTIIITIIFLAYFLSLPALH